jgi:hypothetical protein
LSDAIRYQGKDGDMTASGHSYLGESHYDIFDKLSCDNEKRQHLHLAISYFKKALRTRTKLDGPDNHNT